MFEPDLKIRYKLHCRPMRPGRVSQLSNKISLFISIFMPPPFEE